MLKTFLCLFIGSFCVQSAPVHAAGEYAEYEELTALIAQLEQRTTSIVRGRRASDCDVVFVDVDSERELDRIDRAIGATHDAGAVWVIHRKGTAGVADTTIFARAKALGLVYTKVARVSDRDSAEKLVRPRASRSSAR